MGPPKWSCTTALTVNLIFRTESGPIPNINICNCQYHWQNGVQTYSPHLKFYTFYFRNIYFFTDALEQWWKRSSWRGVWVAKALVARCIALCRAKTNVFIFIWGWSWRSAAMLLILTAIFSPTCLDANDDNLHRDILLYSHAAYGRCARR